MSTSSLQAYLQKYKLCSYTDTLSELGFSTVHMISCIPTDEHIAFVQELNVKGIERIRFRAMLNEIHSKSTLSHSPPSIHEPPLKKRKITQTTKTESQSKPPQFKPQNQSFENNSGQISTNSGHNNGVIANNHNPIANTHHHYNIINTYLEELGKLDPNGTFYLKCKLIYKKKDSNVKPSDLLFHADKFSLKSIINIYYSFLATEPLTRIVNGIMHTYKTKIKQMERVLMLKKDFDLKEKLKLCLGKEKENINMNDLILLMICFFNVVGRESILKGVLEMNINRLDEFDFNFRELETLYGTNGLKDNLDKIDVGFSSVTRWYGIHRFIGLRVKYCKWMIENASNNNNVTNNNNVSNNNVSNYYTSDKSDGLSANTNHGTDYNGTGLCLICDVLVPGSNKYWIQHNNGKKHQKKLREFKQN